MAGSVRQELVEYGRRCRVIKLHCVGDSVDGSIPDTSVLDRLKYRVAGWSLDSVKVYPGATGPTADSDLEVEDGDGLDMLGGEGTDLIKNSAASVTVPSRDSIRGPVPITGGMTIKVTNQAVASALYRIDLVCIDYA
jgi:hypothetical protein